MKSNGGGQISQKSTDQITRRPRTTSLDDDQIITSSSSSTGDKYAKFYDCNFCEKGFSNAQALGGHMNIHRRDRAKLREELSSSVVSSSSAVTITDRDDAAAGQHHLDREQMAGRPKWFRIYSEEEHNRGSAGKGERVHAIHGQGDQLLEPLLLFGDRRPTSSASKDGKASAKVSRGVRETELDLELRLGLEPPEPSIPRRRSL